MNLTKHLALAYKKLHPPLAEEKQELLIKRSFPVYPMQRQVYFPVMEKGEKKPEIKEESFVFDIGKLTKFTIDKTIDLIECPGPDQFVKVKRGTSAFMTDIRLTEDEIKSIIRRFSDESKTAVTPIFRAVAKGFSITAIISSTGSRFLVSRIRI